MQFAREWVDIDKSTLPRGIIPKVSIIQPRLAGGGISFIKRKFPLVGRSYLSWVSPVFPERLLFSIAALINPYATEVKRHKNSTIMKGNFRPPMTSVTTITKVTRRSYQRGLSPLSFSSRLFEIYQRARAPVIFFTSLVR